MFVTTALALDSNETSFKAPTVQVRIEFIAHERGQARPLLTYRVEERPGVLLDGLIESGVFGSMTCVVVLGIRTAGARVRVGSRVHAHHCSPTKYRAHRRASARR